MVGCRHESARNGCGGFIGFHTAKRLIERGDEVIGFDAVNDYYDPSLKEARLSLLAKSAATAQGSWSLVRADLTDQAAVKKTFEEHFDRVIHLAAQAGVRHSLTHPRDYINSNIVGFLNILEACRDQSIPHLTYASTSSVLWSQPQAAFLRARGRRPPAAALCRDKAI